MTRFARLMLWLVLLFPVLLLAGLLALAIFGPMDLPPISVLAIAGVIVMLAAYTAKLGKDNQ